MQKGRDRFRVRLQSIWDAFGYGDGNPPPVPPDVRTSNRFLEKGVVAKRSLKKVEVLYDSILDDLGQNPRGRPEFHGLSAEKKEKFQKILGPKSKFIEAAKSSLGANEKKNTDDSRPKVTRNEVDLLQNTLKEYKRPVVFDLSSRMFGAIAGSLTDMENKYSERNKDIIHGYDSGRDVKGLSGQALWDVVKQLVVDLSNFSPSRKPIRFLCANTTVEGLGDSSWSSEDSLRFLVKGTRSALQIAQRLECIRVFFLEHPRELLIPERLGLLYATLEENRAIGVTVILSNHRAIEKFGSISYSDFYCIVGKKAYLSMVPSYILCEFVRDKAEDVAIVDYFSTLSDYLVDSANDLNDTNIFVWDGGIQDDLKSFLEIMI